MAGFFYFGLRSPLREVERGRGEEIETPRGQGVRKYPGDFLSGF